MKINIVFALLLAGIIWTDHVYAAEVDLIDLERKLAAAVLASDFDMLDEIYAEDFVFTHITGDVDTKATWIECLRTARCSYTGRSVDQIDVETHGNVAITSGRIHAKSDSDDPRWHEYSIWYVRVYEMQSGRWRLLSHRSIREESGPLTD